MSKFDLEQFKNGRRAVTRSGHLAEFVGYEPRSKRFQLAVYVDGSLALFTTRGDFLLRTNDPLDLVAMESLVNYKSVTCYTNGETLTLEHGTNKEATEEFQKLEESRSDVVTCVIFAYTKGEQ